MNGNAFSSDGGRSLLSVILFGISLVVCAIAVTMMAPLLGDYYTSFYPATHAWIGGSYILYDGSYEFYSPPWMLGILIPFAVLPFQASQVVWVAFTLLCIVISVRCYGNFPPYLVALAIINQPMLNMLGNGQMDAVPLLGISVGYLAVKRKNAMLLAVGLFLVATKPQNLILASMLLLLERWAWRALGLPIVASVVSGLFVGMDWMWRYLQAIQNNPPPLKPQTTIWHSPLPVPLVVVGMLVSVALFIFVVKRERLTKRTFALALSTNLAYGIYTLSAHYIMLIPAFLLMSNQRILIALLFYAMSWSLSLFPIGNWIGVLYPLSIQIVGCISVWGQICRINSPRQRPQACPSAGSGLRERSAERQALRGINHPPKASP